MRKASEVFVYISAAVSRCAQLGELHVCQETTVELIDFESRVADKFVQVEKASKTSLQLACCQSYSKYYLIKDDFKRRHNRRQ